MTTPSATPPSPPDDVAPPSDADLARHTSELLDGAARSATGPAGFCWLDADGQPEPGRGLQLWINARMTHLFSLGTLLGRDGDAALADRGVQALATVFADPEHGGWFSRVDLDGNGRAIPDGDGTKAAYDHAFVLLAASSATAAGRPGAADLFAQARDVVQQRFWDDDAGRCVEQWSRDWSVLDGYRGANANMHAVEAFLATADVLDLQDDPGAAAWRARAARIARALVDGHARTHGWRMPEHFDDTWTVQPDYNRDAPDDPFRPYGVTPGHGLEWARLLLHLDAALARAGEEPEPWLVPAATALFDRAVLDGWQPGGGFVYTTGWDGVPVVTERFHWVVAEAIGTASVLHRVTGDDRFAAWYATFWDWAHRVLVAPAGFGWIHEVDAEGRLATRTWTGRPDWYHAVQATLIPQLPVAPTLAAALTASGAPPTPAPGRPPSR